MQTHSMEYRFDTTTGDLAAIIDLASEPVDPGQRRRLYCRVCKNSITEEGQRVSIDGDHIYTRSNPAGMRFCFGCFTLAPGCAAVGAVTGQHSWFRGCRWQVAVCRGCGEHLGWRFHGSHAFFGLILGRLVSDPDAGH